MKTKRKTPNRVKPQVGVFGLGRPAKSISFMGTVVKPRPLKKNEFNKAPLKGLNIVNVRSPNIYNISPGFKRPVRNVRPFSMIIKKESTSQKAPLSKWGDADMDGTVNFLDCSPRNIANDGFFGDTVNKIKSAFTKKKESDIQDPIDKIAEISERTYEYRDRVKTKQAEAEIAFDRDLNQREQEIVAKQTKDEYIAELKAADDKKDKKEKMTKVQKKRLLAPLAKMLPTNVVNKNWSTKRARESQRRITGGVLNAISSVLPGDERLVGARSPYGVKKVGSGGGGTKKSVGRPKGSFKHRIPGRGLVSGEEYDNWEKKQEFRGQAGTVGGPKPIYRREPRPLQTSTNMHPEVMTAEPIQTTVMTAKPMGTNPEIQSVTQPGQRMPSDPYKAAVKAKQMLLQANDNVLNVERLEAPNIMKGEMVDTGDGDNILNAPNINQGEMRAVYVDHNSNVLSAPNMMKGEMKKPVTQEVGYGVRTVGPGERPQTNEYGDEYKEIEIGSGRAIIKTRTSEKWATGEAL